MLKAIKSYDENKGKFLTWFGWYLHEHLKRYVYSYSGVGINTNDLINKYNRTITELEELGEIPTDTRIAHKRALALKRRRNWQNYRKAG